MREHKGKMIQVYTEKKMSSIVSAGGVNGFMNLGFEYVPGERTSSRTKQIQMVKEVFKLLDPQDGETIADIGCGKGGAMNLLLSSYNVKSVIGINIDPYQILNAKDLLNKNGVLNRASFVEADLEEDPLEGISVDAAYGIEIVTHIKDKRSFFQKLYRILKPGGRLALAYMTLNRPFDEYSDEDQEYMLNIGKYFNETPRDFLTEREYNKCLSEVGFKEKKTINVTDNVFSHRYISHLKVLAGLTSRNPVIKLMHTIYWKHKENCDIEYLKQFLSDQTGKHHCRLYEYYLTLWEK